MRMREQRPLPWFRERQWEQQALKLVKESRGGPLDSNGLDFYSCGLRGKVKKGAGFPGGSENPPKEGEF